MVKKIRTIIPLLLYLVCIFHVENIRYYKGIPVCSVDLRLKEYEPWYTGDFCGEMFLFGVTRISVIKDDCKGLKVGDEATVMINYGAPNSLETPY